MGRRWSQLLSGVDAATLGVLSWAMLLQVLAGVYRLLEMLHDAHVQYLEKVSRTVTYPGGRGIFRWLYTYKITDAEAYTGRVDLCSPFNKPVLRRLRFPLIEREAGPRALRQLSLLSVGVIALVRFAMGEPILQLF